MFTNERQNDSESTEIRTSILNHKFPRRLKRYCAWNNLGRLCGAECYSTNLSALTIVLPLIGKHEIYVGIRWASKEQQFGGITLTELDTFGRTIRRGNSLIGLRTVPRSPIRECSTHTLSKYNHQRIKQSFIHNSHSALRHFRSTLETDWDTAQSARRLERRLPTPHSLPWRTTATWSVSSLPKLNTLLASRAPEPELYKCNISPAIQAFYHCHHESDPSSGRGATLAAPRPRGTKFITLLVRVGSHHLYANVFEPPGSSPPVPRANGAPLGGKVGVMAIWGKITWVQQRQYHRAHESARERLLCLALIPTLHFPFCESFF